LITSKIGSASRPHQFASRLGVQALGILEHGDPAVALALSWLAMLLVQNASPNIIGIDGYYHIKFAWLMRQDGLRLEFPWLPITILNPQDFTDHHLLYHVLLVPFTFLDLREGAKLAGLVFSSLAVFGSYWLMTRLRIRYALVWLVVLLGSSEWFLARESMTRRQSVSLALLLLATYLLVEGRFRWMLPLACAYAWLYDGFILLLAVAGLGFAARLLAQRCAAWPILGWTALGLGLALVFNPYFPNNVRFTYLHLLPKIIPESEVTVGSEWYPYTLPILLETSWLALLLLPLGFLPAVWASRRMVRDRTALFLAALAVLFLVLYLRSRRFIEIQPPFAVLFCSYAWARYFPAGGVGGLLARLSRTARVGLAIAALLALGGQTWMTVGHAQENVAVGRHFTTFEAASLWVQQNSEPGERVYQTDWDVFPELFFYNTSNTYIIGLDPTYMFLADPQLYRQWSIIGHGEAEFPSRAIRDQFGARWVITDRAHQVFIAQAARDPDMEMVFEAPGALVYRVGS
jgi:hypothetical protein